MELIVQAPLSNWKSQATARGGESLAKLPWKYAETPAVNKALINTHMSRKILQGRKKPLNVIQESHGTSTITCSHQPEWNN